MTAAYVLLAILAVVIVAPRLARAINAWAERECERFTERALGPQRATETPIHDRLAAEYRRAS